MSPKPSKTCELCEIAAAEPGDCFCVPCRVEVTALSEIVHSPVEITLSRHWRMEPLSDDESSMCRCGLRFDGGPGIHRRHLAEEIHKALGLDEPLPHTPAAFEDGSR